MSDGPAISPVFLFSHADHAIPALPHVSPAMGGSVAAPVASGRGQGETRRERSLRPLPTVSPAARCYWRAARETRSQVFKERLLLTFGRSGPKVSRPEGTKSFYQRLGRSQEFLKDGEPSLALLQVLRALPAGFFLLLRPKERTKEKGVSNLAACTPRPRS